MNINAWHLGATLYVPSTHRDLAEVFAGHRLAGARSVVICFEDEIGRAHV